MYPAKTELNPCRPVNGKSLKASHFLYFDLGYSNIWPRSKQRANEPDTSCTEIDHCSACGSLYEVRYLVQEGTDSCLGSNIPLWASGNKTFEIIDNIFHLLWKKTGLKFLTEHLGWLRERQ